MMRKTGLFIPVWMADLFSDGLKQGKLERRPVMNRGENTSSQLSNTAGDLLVRCIYAVFCQTE
jgi:hypothetical protein